MEVFIFPDELVRAQKVKFVEARLHSDSTDLELRERIAELIETVAENKAQPIYVVLDPQTEKEINRFNGATLGNPDQFAGFLRDMLEKLRNVH